MKGEKERNLFNFLPYSPWVTAAVRFTRFDRFVFFCCLFFTPNNALLDITLPGIDLSIWAQTGKLIG